jgi:hypothetical protein
VIQTAGTTAAAAAMANRIRIRIPTDTDTAITRALVLPTDQTVTDPSVTVDMIENEMTTQNEQTGTVVTSEAETLQRSPLSSLSRRESSHDAIWRPTSRCSQCTWIFKKASSLKICQKKR